MSALLAVLTSAGPVSAVGVGDGVGIADVRTFGGGVVGIAGFSNVVDGRWANSLAQEPIPWHCAVVRHGVDLSIASGPIAATSAMEGRPDVKRFGYENRFVPTGRTVVMFVCKFSWH